MISVKINNSTGTILLDRPERCNALSRGMLQELQTAIDDLHQTKSVRGILIMGAGNHFCAGLDLKELVETAHLQSTERSMEAMQQWHEDSRLLLSVIEQLLRLPKPVISAVDGHCLGAGFALALASDLVLASHPAKFGIAGKRTGIVSGITIPLLQFRCGAALASRLAIGGAQISAPEAAEQGLVHHLIDSDQLWVRASNWIEAMSEQATEYLQLSKRVLNEMVGEELLKHLSSGAAALATSLTTEAACEGLQAFSEKRDPQFPS